MTGLPEREVFAKTVFAEARGESEEGQKAVAEVIKTRAELNKPYWGGSSIKDVCLKEGQFECWNGVKDISTEKEPEVYRDIKRRTDEMYDAPANKAGPDHYNNPSKEGKPDWTKNCDEVEKIGEHQFYRTKSGH